MTGTSTLSLSDRVRQAKEQLDAQVRDMIAWHFNPETGMPVLAGVCREAELGPAKRDSYL